MIWYNNQPKGSLAKGNTKHGMRHTAEYDTWCKIKSRCLNPNNKDYEEYAGRGITISKKWINDFMAFYLHIGKKPEGKYSIDRIDNDKGYIPGNVRWATDSEQQLNKRVQSRSKSGVTGVHWSKIVNKWSARKTINGKRYQVGYFHTVAEAKQAIDSYSH